MATTLDSSGVTFPDGSTQTKTATSGQTGSAPFYSARAWVNFNGAGTVAIRASGNVSSITDGGAGRYTVNFTTAMPDVNYITNISSGSNVNAGYSNPRSESTAPTTTAVQVGTFNSAGALADSSFVYVVVFR